MCTYLYLYLSAVSCLFFGDSSKPLASFIDGNAIPVLASSTPGASGKTLETMNAVHYRGVSLMGWALHSQNNSAVMFLLRRGINPMSIVDSHKNNALHFAVLNGSLANVDSCLNAHDEPLIFEEENEDGFTAGELGIKMGDNKIMIKLLRCGCSARRALTVGYWAYVLAVARERESREMNTQTGVYGSDDELYFATHPDPNYFIWDT
jgi:hypothetical protein